MFEPKENPGYDKLCHDAAGLIAQWSRNDWYETSGEELEKLEDGEEGKGKEQAEPAPGQ